MAVSPRFAPGFVALFIPDSMEDTRPDDALHGMSLSDALRRAEEEMIATLRSNEPRAAARHREMASHYSMRALELIERNGDEVAVLQSRRASS